MTRELANCIRCGREFIKYRSDNVYCSPICCFEYKREKNLRDIACECCGKLFRSTKCKKFCSKECSSLFHREKNRQANMNIIKICMICGKQFCAKTKDTYICSKECKTESYRRRIEKLKQRKKDENIPKLEKHDYATNRRISDKIMSKINNGKPFTMKEIK